MAWGSVPDLCARFFHFVLFCSSSRSLVWAIGRGVRKSVEARIGQVRGVMSSAAIKADTVALMLLNLTICTSLAAA